MKPISDPTAASSKITASPRKRWLQRGAMALVIYAVIGFLIVPAIVKWQLRKQLPALTQRVAVVEQVRMNPFALSLTVRGLALTETNGTPFAALDELYVNFQLSSIFRRAWTFGEIRLAHPTANVIRFADGSFNFSNLVPVETTPATNPPSAPPPLLIHSLVVTNAVISFADATTPRDFRSDYGPLHLALADFTTRPHRDGTYSFVVSTDEGESFSWAGSISINPLRSSGQFELRGIPPGKYGPYLAHFATVRVERGTLDIGAKYRVDATAQPLELEVTNATVALRELLVKPPDRDVTLLGIEHFQITNTWASLTGRVARVGLVELAGGQVFVSRETNGRPTLLNYLVVQPDKTQPGETNSAVPPAPAEGGTTNESPWRFDLDELSVSSFALALEDRSTAGVAELGLDDLALNVKGTSNQSNAPVSVTLSFLWRGGGSVNLAARGTVLPPALDTSLAISNFALAPLQPYFGQHLNLTVHSGDLSVAGAARFDPAGVPQIQFHGDVSITNFNSSDTVAYHELSAWDNLGIRGIEFSLQTNWLRIAEIKFTGARNNLVISSNGVLNLSALAKSSATLDGATNEVVVLTATASNAVPTEPFPLQIGAVVLERSSFRAADDSLYRSFETRVAEFDASVRDIVMPGLNQAQVDVRGKVSALAPFEIVGRVTPDPQNLFVDLKVAFTNTDLTSLSPYTEKYVGRPLTKGKLTTALSYHIENRQLTASNIINLDQLTLGARVESPDATKLPVKLAIGLLKDLDGQIDLDLPMSGSLDDPKFSIWGLVGQTMQNLILKVSTSPFALLGALAGGGAELQFVDFDPGRVTLNDSQTNKLMKLSEALAKRPALSLEVGATFDPVADVDALGRQMVLAQMKTKRIEELVARGRPAPAMAELQLEPDDYERLLRQAYRTAFNTTPEQALREALAAALATNAVSDVSVPTASPTRTDAGRGATALMNQGKSLAQLAAAARGTTTNSTAATDAKPLSEKELVLDEMERRLAGQQPPTPAELRSLMQKRIAVVHEFLVQTAGVAADRVLSTEPNPDDPQRRGLARVVFSLE